jgi:arylsulfatase A-like enzyme
MILKRLIPTLSTTLLCCLWIAKNEKTWADSQRPPNIVFVLADDLGWAELGCYGNTFHETPNLDRMAENGLRFTRAYAAAPVCSPYRAALLTGQHPARLGIHDYLRPNSANRLSTDLVTLPELLKHRGYRTGMIGKWHLTGYKVEGAEFETRPTDHGFDWNLCSEVKSVGNGANTWPYVFRTQPIRWIDIPDNRLGPKENLTDRLNLEAVDYIERNQDRPFFLLLAHYAPHTILNGRPDLVEKYRKKHAPGRSGRANCYLCEDAGLGKGDPGHHWAIDHNPHLAAMLEGIDDGIGMIRDKLAERNLLENTIFIFTSDNGGESNITSNAPLRGGKSELYEGGIRVPLVVQWPAKTEGGRVSEEPTMNTDFFPTLLEAVGIGPQTGQPVDGVSALAHWLQPTQPIEHGPLHWHYPIDQPHFLGGFSGGAILKDGWKLIERFNGAGSELYHLDRDPSERLDMSVEKSLKVEELEAQLAIWRRNVSARIPPAPLLTEPRRLYFAEHFSGRVSDRIQFSDDWLVENGILVCSVGDGDKSMSQILVKDTTFRDAIVRFDFRLQRCQELQLVTYSGKTVNAVVHIRPDRFFVESGKGRSKADPAHRLWQCAYPFDPNLWYTMTVEFIGDQLIAHIDREHYAYLRHPSLNLDRGYLALSVDDQPAAFDNVQILGAKEHPSITQTLRRLLAKRPGHHEAK